MAALVDVTGVAVNDTLQLTAREVLIVSAPVPDTLPDEGEKL